jgi:hypothetical protein
LGTIYKGAIQMNLNAKQTLSIAILLFFLCCLSGCATGSGAHRFYSGPPLPKNEIALVYAVVDCHIHDVRNMREEETKYLDYLKGDAASRMLELLPGQYMIGITYSRSSTAVGYETRRTQTLGDKVRLKISAGAGNVYIIYPSFNGGKWQPIIANINDYSEEECEKHNKSGCPNKEGISKRSNKYFLGERPIMIFHPLSETSYAIPVTEEAKRDIKGFWW